MQDRDAFISNLISRLSPEEKVGNLLTLGFAGVKPDRRIHEFIEKFQCGGLRLSPDMREFGDYIHPETGEVVVAIETREILDPAVPVPHMTPAQYKEVLDGLQRRAIRRPSGIPLHFSFDAEGGHYNNFNISDLTRYPSAMGMRASDDPDLIYRLAKAVARELRAIGFSYIHSPYLDMSTDPLRPASFTRAFSDRTEDVTVYGVAQARGYKEGGLITAAKHFPGKGESSTDPHFGMPVNPDSRETLMQRNIPPYEALFAEDLVPSVMLNHQVYTAFDEEHVATCSKKIATDLLREELGFDGVITTDSITMGGIALRYSLPKACVLTLHAGSDLVLLKAEGGLVEKCIEAIMQAIDSGDLSEAEVDTKLRRVLSMKAEYGLFDTPIPELNLDEIRAQENTAETLEIVSRRCVQIARDRERLLPLAKDARVAVIEQAAPSPNDYVDCPGKLYRACRAIGENVRYIEIGFHSDEEDLERVRGGLGGADCVVITSGSMRGKMNARSVHLQIIQAAVDSGKQVIVVSSAPYTLAVPENVGTAVICFSDWVAAQEKVAGILLGTEQVEGAWPIEYRLPE